MGDRLRPALALGLFLCGSMMCGPALADEMVSYSYDARGRLIAVSRSGTINNGVSAAYSYDKADNRTNVTVATGGAGFAGSQAPATESAVPAPETPDVGLIEASAPADDEQNP